MHNILLSHHEAGAAVLPMVIACTVFLYRAFAIRIKVRRSRKGGRL